MGAALGYIGAGQLTHFLSWRWVFYTEAMVMTVLAFLVLFVPYYSTSTKKEEEFGLLHLVRTLRSDVD